MLRKQRREMPQGTAEGISVPHSGKDPGASSGFYGYGNSLAKEDKEIVSLRIIGGFSHRGNRPDDRILPACGEERYERAIQKLRREYEEEERMTDRA